MRRRRDIRREMVHCRKVLSLRIIHSEPMDGWNGTMMLLREICWVLLGFGMCKYDMAAKKNFAEGLFVCLQGDEEEQSMSKIKYGSCCLMRLE